MTPRFPSRTVALQAVFAVVLLWVTLLFAWATLARAAETAGRLRGRVVSTSDGQPVASIAVVALRRDVAGASQPPRGAMTAVDGTYRIELPAGPYRIKVQGVGYTPKIFPDVEITRGQTTELTVDLTAQTLQQEEVVVRGALRKSNEAALLTQQRKAATVGDGISSEQVRRNGDSDAAKALTRVTGTTVSNNKYVVVRGLGERYSSTEIDGVRLTSPEQNKRVVPLDLVPASLLDNIVVQKTYTADRPGEFGGGDVQITTKDFPGRRLATFSASQGYDSGTSLSSGFLAAGRGSADWRASGAGDRALPGLVREIAEHTRIKRRGNFDNAAVGFSADTLRMIGQAFRNEYTPTATHTGLNGSYQQSFGEELRLFGQPLSFVESASLSNTANADARSRQLSYASQGELVSDYDVKTYSRTSQLGAMGNLAYRIHNQHTLRLRSVYTRTGEDQVRTFEGPLVSSNTNVRDLLLLYTQSTISSASLEGEHLLRTLPFMPVAKWRLSRSRASRIQPDRRETYRNERDVESWENPDSTVAIWPLGQSGVTREYGDLADRGQGADGSLRLRIPTWRGEPSTLSVGGSHQASDREAFYRRFIFLAPNSSDLTSLPESLFAPERWGRGSAIDANINETTNNDDSYGAHTAIDAWFASWDVPVAAGVRSVVGLRREHGVQDVRTFDYFRPDSTMARATLDHVDWLPSVNATWALSEIVNVRAAASRTLSRPDLRELTVGRFIDPISNRVYRGNPALDRALIENWDLRAEAFPSLAEVLAVGVFYKHFYGPIENTFIGSSGTLIEPVNSRGGYDKGVELEARLGLGRFTPRLAHLTMSGNASLLRSEVQLPREVTQTGTLTHPLQGQAETVVNLGLSYALPSRVGEATVLYNHVGPRLETIGFFPEPDYYQTSRTTLDLTASWKTSETLRLRFTGRNLTDAAQRVESQRGLLVSESYPGRSFALGASLEI